MLSHLLKDSGGGKKWLNVAHNERGRKNRFLEVAKQGDLP
jgi:hypothetical protein